MATEWQRINHYLIQDARAAQDSEASPSAGVIDSQSVKTKQSPSIRGYNTGKKVKGNTVTRFGYACPEHVEGVISI
jgi:hypothetical protein